MLACTANGDNINIQHVGEMSSECLPNVAPFAQAFRSTRSSKAVTMGTANTNRQTSPGVRNRATSIQESSSKIPTAARWGRWFRRYVSAHHSSVTAVNRYIQIFNIIQFPLLHLAVLQLSPFSFFLCVIQIGPVPSPSRATLGKSPIQLARPQGGSSFPTPRTQGYHLTLRPQPRNITLHEGPTPGISLYTKALGISFLRILIGVVIFRTIFARGGQFWRLFRLGSCLGLWGRGVHTILAWDPGSIKIPRGHHTYKRLPGRWEHHNIWWPEPRGHHSLMQWKNVMSPWLPGRGVVQGRIEWHISGILLQC